MLEALGVWKSFQCSWWCWKTLIRVMQTERWNPRVVAKVNDFRWSWHHHDNRHKKCTNPNLSSTLISPRIESIEEMNLLRPFALVAFLLVVSWWKLHFSAVGCNSHDTKKEQELYIQNPVLPLFLSSPLNVAGTACAFLHPLLHLESMRLSKPTQLWCHWLIRWLHAN